ncbi:hypothetical protein Cni_G03857 [Canna indica]|uniref:DUF7792 domain-containing protein n=1 Tax=Canna indica TaxID=4628 RepID=A0AAQ3JVM7_9LILI|nr:hypothetical protein Cni_G03857 [Canna indica]
MPEARRTPRVSPHSTSQPNTLIRLSNLLPLHVSQQQNKKNWRVSKSQGRRRRRKKKMGDVRVKQMLAKPIQMADQLSKLTRDAHSFMQECAELKTKAEHLAGLLRQAARSDLSERPARRIMDNTGQALDRALAVVAKCRARGLVRRLFAIVTAAAFKKVFVQLDNSVADVSWLIHLSSSADLHLGLPPIAQNEPILFLIWEQIATLHAGSLDARADAAASLVSLALDNDRYGKLIIEEDGIGPLLRLVKDGRPVGQENAAHAIGLLALDPDAVEQMVLAGACSAFAQILKDGPMKVQATVAWAVAELAASLPKCQDIFAQNNVVPLLVSHLAFETVPEHSKYSIPSFVMASGRSSTAANKVAVAIDHIANKKQNASLAGTSIKKRESEDPVTKAHIKAMAAKALRQLAKGNPAICKSITESKALLCFAVLLEKGTSDVQYNSVMALMEIARVAEQHDDLRRSAFKPSSPAAHAVVDQLVRIVKKAEHDELLIPCIVALGCLSRTFRATETRIIAPLVRLLDGREAAASREAAIALTKFACTGNYLHVGHSKAIIEAGGIRYLVQLVYFGEQMVQIAALVLLCHVALHVPDSEALAQADVLAALEWVSSSKQGYLVQDPTVNHLLLVAKVGLELYQSRDAISKIQLTFE